MTWKLSRTGKTTDLPDSFNLQEYTRETAFIQNTIDGTDGVVIDSESIRNTPQRLVLTGFIKGTDAKNADAKLMAIETVATSDATDLTLTNTVTNTKYTVQHVRTKARRDGNALLYVTLTFLTNFTKI